LWGRACCGETRRLGLPRRTDRLTELTDHHDAKHESGRVELGQGHTNSCSAEIAAATGTPTRTHTAVAIATPLIQARRVISDFRFSRSICQDSCTPTQATRGRGGRYPWRCSCSIRADGLLILARRSVFSRRLVVLAMRRDVSTTCASSIDSAYCVINK
jgi:hypothetical protein